LTLRAQLLSPDGAEAVEGSAGGGDPDELGARLAADLLDRAPPAIRGLFAG
jgi:hydroxymethylbilane synthase